MSALSFAMSPRSFNQGARLWEWTEELVDGALAKLDQAAAGEGAAPRVKGNDWYSGVGARRLVKFFRIAGVQSSLREMRKNLNAHHFTRKYQTRPGPCRSRSAPRSPG